LQSTGAICALSNTDFCGRSAARAVERPAVRRGSALTGIRRIVRQNFDIVRD
jgi:hypothetical protein